MAIFVLCLIFKKPLKSFLERIVLLKAPGVEVSAPARADQQLVESKNPAAEDQLAQPVVVQQTLPIPEDLVKRQQAVRNFGEQAPIVLEQMENIRTNLRDLEFPLDSSDTVDVLIRHLAVTQLLVRFEGTYRMIFGSQIALLQLIHHSGAQTEDTVRSIFERAKAVSPGFYAGYSFEDWSTFLLRQGTVLFEDGLYTGTVYGNDFLAWMVAARAPQKSTRLNSSH